MCSLNSRKKTLGLQTPTYRFVLHTLQENNFHSSSYREIGLNNEITCTFQLLKRPVCFQNFHLYVVDICSIISSIFDQHDVFI